MQSFWKFKIVEKAVKMYMMDRVRLYDVIGVVSRC